MSYLFSFSDQINSQQVFARWTIGKLIHAASVCVTRSPCGRRGIGIVKLDEINLDVTIGIAVFVENSPAYLPFHTVPEFDHGTGAVGNGYFRLPVISFGMRNIACYLVLPRWQFPEHILSC